MANWPRSCRTAEGPGTIWKSFIFYWTNCQFDVKTNERGKSANSGVLPLLLCWSTSLGYFVFAVPTGNFLGLDVRLIFQVQIGLIWNHRFMWCPNWPAGRLCVNCSRALCPAAGLFVIHSSSFRNILHSVIHRVIHNLAYRFKNKRPQRPSSPMFTRLSDLTSLPFSSAQQFLVVCPAEQIFGFENRSNLEVQT